MKREISQNRIHKCVSSAAGSCFHPVIHGRWCALLWTRTAHDAFLGVGIHIFRFVQQRDVFRSISLFALELLHATIDSTCASIAAGAPALLLEHDQHWDWIIRFPKVFSWCPP
ncbi:hypothetical protein PVAP13_5KG022100 [Panicum virgatum]|uniref:Uncharacterized protein n=1 Tax=Panicum virgatum TaxID=38727 RepID=A0A8T0SCF8_PANVG|nr:hypothetical protein PVAP13_5KG022100 [Panicum virgatum]